MTQFVDSNEQDVQAINLTIEQAQASIRLGQALERLERNPDFQTLIIGEYLREQPIRLGHLVSDPTMQSKEKRKNILAELRSVGDFLSFLRSTSQRAHMAMEAVRINEEELQSIHEANAVAE